MSCKTIFVAGSFPTSYSVQDIDYFIQRLKTFGVDCVVLLSGLTAFKNTNNETEIFVPPLDIFDKFRNAGIELRVLPGIIEFLAIGPQVDIDKIKLNKRLKKGIVQARDFLINNRKVMSIISCQSIESIPYGDHKVIFTSPLFWLNSNWYIDNKICRKVNNEPYYQRSKHNLRLNVSNINLDLKSYNYFPDEYIISVLKELQYKPTDQKDTWLLPSLDVNFNILKVRDDLIINVPKLQYSSTTDRDNSNAQIDGVLIHPLIDKANDIYPEITLGL